MSKGFRIRDGLVWSYGPPPTKLGSSWNGMAIVKRSGVSRCKTQVRHSNSRGWDESWYDGCKIVAINGRRVK